MDPERHPHFTVIQGGKQAPLPRQLGQQSADTDDQKLIGQAAYRAYLHVRTFVYLRREEFNRLRTMPSSQPLRTEISDSEFFALYLDFIYGQRYIRCRKEDYLHRCVQCFGTIVWMGGYCPRFIHDYIEDRMDVKRPDNVRFFIELAAYVNEQRPGYFAEDEGSEKKC